MGSQHWAWVWDGPNEALGADLQELWAAAVRGVASAYTIAVLGNTAASEKPQKSSDRKTPLFLSPSF